MRCMGAVVLGLTLSCAGRSERYRPASPPDGEDPAAMPADPTDPFACACPDAGEASYEAYPECFWPEGVSCGALLIDEIDELWARSGGLVSVGCGREIVYPSYDDAWSIGCMYDDSGRFVGEFRSNPPQCPGTEIVTWGGAPYGCPDTPTCWLGPGEAPEGAEVCPEPLETYATPECHAYHDLPLVYACASLIGTCESSLDDYVQQLSDAGILDEASLVSGCGMTQIELGSLSGATYTFDESGDLIGFLAFGDVAWGPCDEAVYARGFRGSLRDTCPTYHACSIPIDWEEGGVACR